MKFSSVLSRAVLRTTVVISLLPGTACQYKRAAKMSHSTGLSGYLYDSAPAPTSEGGDDRQESNAILRLVSAQTESTTPQRKIIRNGSLELVVSDVGQVANQIRAAVDTLGGFVEKSTQTNVGGHSAVITVRVPVENLDRAMSQIKSLATTVDRESVEARDVTREYIDLEARLRNAQAEEARYLETLKRATTVKDTLEGAEKLSGVRGRIEQLQGEMKYLTTQIDMSSLEISLQTEAGATVLGVHWRPLRQAKIAIGEMTSGRADWADSVIAFFINLPLILVWVVSVLALVVVTVRILRFCWRKLGPKKTWTLPWRRSRGETGTT